jgi:hypothetical protein
MPGRFHRTFTCDAALRTLQRPTKLGGRLLRVNAHRYNTLSTSVIATPTVIC